MAGAQSSGQLQLPTVSKCTSEFDPRIVWCCPHLEPLRSCLRLFWLLQGLWQLACV